VTDAPRKAEQSAGEGLFRTALLVKGLDGAVELLVAAVLAFGVAAPLDELVRAVLDHHLLGGRYGVLAERFAAAEGRLTGPDRTFAVVYLGLHGLIKCGLVVAMARRVRPAYPVAAVVLGVFVAYELYRAAHTGSILLPVFAAIDLGIIVLILREYRRLSS